MPAPEDRSLHKHVLRRAWRHSRRPQWRVVGDGEVCPVEQRAPNPLKRGLMIERLKRQLVKAFGSVRISSKWRRARLEKELRSRQDCREAGRRYRKTSDTRTRLPTRETRVLRSGSQAADRSSMANVASGCFRSCLSRSFQLCCMLQTQVIDARFNVQISSLSEIGRAHV